MLPRWIIRRGFIVGAAGGRPQGKLPVFAEGLCGNGAGTAGRAMLTPADSNEAHIGTECCLPKKYVEKYFINENNSY